MLRSAMKDVGCCLSYNGIGTAGYTMLKVGGVAMGALIFEGVPGMTLADYIVGEM